MAMAELVSPYLIAIVAAWVVAHGIKYFRALNRGKPVDLAHQMFVSGGMPSAHAATTMAVWMVILLRDDWRSGLFGLATLVALIVCYDSVKVRRSSGEQGEAIAQLIRETKSTVRVPRAAKGHTPLELLAGSVLGVIVGAVVFLATR